MRPEIAAILWTVLFVLISRPGFLGGIIVAIVSYGVFYLLASLPISFFQQFPWLRPSSVPLCIVASLLLVVTAVYRVRSPLGPSSKHATPLK